MADPLSQLRQFHINGREIKEHNGYIIFGDHGWPKNVNTNYQVYSTDDDKSKKEYYTLECLLYFLRNMDVAHTHYVRQAGCDNKPAVHRPDRKHLLAYLKGEAQTAPGIDKNAPIPSLRVPASEIYKRDPPASSDPQPSTSSQASNSQSQNDASRADGQLQSAKKRPVTHDEDITKVREQFAARLNEPSTKKMATILPNESALKVGETDESSAAISKFGKEKLAAMRAKHLAVKRTQIIDADTEPGFGPSEPGGREDLLYAMDADKFKLIKSKEKIWRTRTSILQSQTKNFGKSILNMLTLLSKSDDPSKKTHPSMPPMPADLQIHSQQPNHPQPPQAIQRNSYNRYDQERFVKLNIGVEIDTKKSFVGGVSNGITPYGIQSQPALPTARPPVTGPVASNGVPQMPRSHDTVDHRHHHRPPSRPSKRTSVVPIIVIPATNTSIINMYNAATMLQDLTYVEGKPGSKARENEICIQRKKADGSTALYKVIDNPLKLEREDWVRVVAVFVQGPAWQFKGWPYNGSPVEIFSNIKGFHLKWDDSKLDENVARWNVQILELSHNKRHLDKANLLKFWSSLDSFMMKYKSFLKF
uniref:Parafibromin n=1 Tax=Aceria tosichella TaxID=561515 RepID=A0A6G1SE07_9ACAR